MAAEQNPLFHFRTEDGLLFVYEVDLWVPVEVVHLLLTLLLLVVVVVGPVAVLLLVVLQLHLGVEESLASAAPKKTTTLTCKRKTKSFITNEMQVTQSTSLWVHQKLLTPNVCV